MPLPNTSVTALLSQARLHTRKASKSFAFDSSAQHSNWSLLDSYGLSVCIWEDILRSGSERNEQKAYNTNLTTINTHWNISSLKSRELYAWRVSRTVNLTLFIIVCVFHPIGKWYGAIYSSVRLRYDETRCSILVTKPFS